MNRKTTMTDLRLLLRELAKGTSRRQISEKMKLSRTSINAYVERLSASGHDASSLLTCDDATIHATLCRTSGHRNRDEHRHDELDAMLQEYAEQKRLKYVTYQILYENYIGRVQNPYGYTQFKAKIQEYEKAHNYSFHNVYEPAVEMQVDFCGDCLYVTSPKTGIHTRVYVLVCVLSYSKLSFAIALPATTMEFFFDALSKCLEYFGGVPQSVKSDNMRQYVKKYDRYETSFTEAANQWSLHYDTALTNTRIRQPRDKGAVESLVNQVYRYYYGRICSGNGSGERMEFHSLDELNSYLFELNDRYNSEIMRSTGMSRMERYDRDERPLMLPLPQDRYVFKYEKTFTVSSTYHVQIGKERHLYSIPYQYVHRKAKAVYDCNTVEIWVDLKRVATHRRIMTEGYTTVTEHMPPKHRAYVRARECNAAYFLDKARIIGPATRAKFETTLDSQPFVQQAYKTCHGLLRLAEKYGSERMEKVCRILQDSPTSSYTAIRHMLEHNLDSAVASNDDNVSYMPVNEDVRGAAAYS